jgi:Ca2+-binding RTX toxin-like protein
MWAVIPLENIQLGHSEQQKKGKAMRRVILVLTVGALLIALTATVALAATRHGTSGHDVLTGTQNADQMYGHAGDDIISGLRGNDLMYGGSGEDALWGSYGDDNLYGRTGADDLHGMGGNDYLSAKDGQRDLVDCGSGRDWYNADSFDVVRNCEVPAV